MAEKFSAPVRQAFREVWPVVQDSLTADKPRMSARKAAVTETLWALTRAGWLRSNADRAVIQAARDWAAVIDPDYPEDYTLYNAVQRLPS